MSNLTIKATLVVVAWICTTFGIMLGINMVHSIDPLLFYIIPAVWSYTILKE